MHDCNTDCNTGCYLATQDMYDCVRGDLPILTAKDRSYDPYDSYDESYPINPTAWVLRRGRYWSTSIRWRRIRGLFRTSTEGMQRKCSPCGNIPTGPNPTSERRKFRDKQLGIQLYCGNKLSVQFWIANYNYNLIYFDKSLISHM